jgi:hypothetical protein
VANVKTDTAGNMPLEHGRGQGESRGGLLARVGMKSERQRCHSKDSHHASDDGSRRSTKTMPMTWALRQVYQRFHGLRPCRVCPTCVPR